MHEWKVVQELGQALYPDGTFQNPPVRSADGDGDFAEEGDDVPETRGDPSKWFVRLGPAKGNLMEWHFTIEGPPASPYEHGLYHGRVLLSSAYPSRAPRVQLLNPSGRFQPKSDICLSASAFHQETWQPSWTVRTLVTALAAHMMTPAREIGGMEQTSEMRRLLALKSQTFVCPHCGADHRRAFAKPEEEGEEKGEKGSLAAPAKSAPKPRPKVQPKAEAKGGGQARVLRVNEEPAAREDGACPISRLLASISKSRTLQATILLIVLIQVFFASVV
mmetsp:Transcript_40139/g.125688  ORF Transcript_40139/g.125688 Transcript_40139/m.125688 type:complete len:276 (-) Transcript_40139:132-959(-)